MQWLRRVYARIMFCPSLVVHDLLCLLGIWRRWSWVDDHVLLGRVPRRSEMVELRDMGVDAVINLCAEFAGHRDLLDHYGMDQLHLPTIDYTSPSLENVRKGVALLRRRSGVGLKTYVHCKAGRGRSPTLVLCYLLKRRRQTCGGRGGRYSADLPINVWSRRLSVPDPMRAL